MISKLIALLVLFFVIIDPLASFAVFFVNTKNYKKKEKIKIAIMAVAIAAVLSFLVLLFGENLLTIFSTDINSFKIAGGIILLILGINMSLGRSIVEVEKSNADSVHAIASVIATPLLTGPATITAIIISAADYGKVLTGVAIGIILLLTGISLYLTIIFHHLTEKAKTTIQIISTMLGLITLAWGVNYILTGVQAIFHLI
ncbi:MAG TPA: MarC family protein [archaeon]|jgi:multiple antibiotic resistance protein|nr:MarC family protein [archaeon]